MSKISIFTCLINSDQISIRGEFTSRFSIKGILYDGVKENDYPQMQFYDMHVYNVRLRDDMKVYTDTLSKTIMGGVQIAFEKSGEERHFKRNIRNANINIESVGQVYTRNGRTFGTVRGEISGLVDDLRKIEKPIPEVDKIKNKRASQRKASYYDTNRRPNRQYKSTSAMTTILGILLLVFLGVRAWNAGQTLTAVLLLTIGALTFLENNLLARLKSFERYKHIISHPMALFLLGGIIVGVIALFSWGGGSGGTRRASALSNIPEDQWIEISGINDSLESTRVKSKNVPPNACEFRSDWVERKLELLDISNTPLRLWYQASAQEACMTHSYREDLYVFAENEYSYFNQLYSSLVSHDSSKLEGIVKVFDKARRERKMKYSEFCHFLVRSVQYIPYSLIIPSKCENCDDHGSYYCGDNCVPGTKFGLFAPSEFVYSKQGDCDTRTVLLLTLLKHFGYDAVILNCDDHSMLGVNIPAFTGESYSYKGKDYYYWETTATGWEPGIIPAGSSYKSWYVALSTDEI